MRWKGYTENCETMAAIIKNLKKYYFTPEIYQNTSNEIYMLNNE